MFGFAPFVRAYCIRPVRHCLNRICKHRCNIARSAHFRAYAIRPYGGYSILERVLSCHPVVELFHCLGNWLAGGCEIPRHRHEAEHETLGGIVEYVVDAVPTVVYLV